MPCEPPRSFLSKRDPLVTLRDMLDIARDGVQIASGHARAELDENIMLRYALIHCLVLVGEAATRVSPSERTRLSGIPWAPIIAMRNHLIHGYETVILDRVWSTVER